MYFAAAMDETVPFCVIGARKVKYKQPFPHRAAEVRRRPIPSLRALAVLFTYDPIYLITEMAANMQSTPLLQTV